MDFEMNIQNFEGKELVTTVKGLVIYINEDSMSRITTSLRGCIGTRGEIRKPTLLRGDFLAK